jgi:hypothetical protein
MRMEEFALSVFAAADKADRDSAVQPPDVSLASRFYIASMFFEVLTQFYSDHQLPPDLEQKRRYAKYRTIQIKNGKPLGQEVTVPPADSVKESAPSELTPKATSKPPPSKPGFQYAESESDESPMRPPAPIAPKPTLASPPRPLPVARQPSVDAAPGSPTVSRADALNAKKKLQQAISAIDFSDYPTAGKLCLESLGLLGINP